MKELTIRRAGPSDAAGLSACIEAAYAKYAALIDDLPAVSAECEREIAENLVWVAEVEDSIVGGLVLVPGDRSMQLANVAVHPDHRGVGAGRRLLALAETESLKRGFRKMHLHTHVLMPENVRLYTRLGWEQVGEEGTKISMRKELTGR